MNGEERAQQLRQALAYIVGEQKLAEMHAAFTKRFVNRLSEQNRGAIVAYDILPEVFVAALRWHGMQWLENLSQTSTHIASLCEEHEPCTFRPFRPWMVVVLDREKEFPARHLRREDIADIPVYFRK